ncbi:MAG: hypothetical protein Q9218_002259 [Villophora microphyllina]
MAAPSPNRGPNLATGENPSRNLARVNKEGKLALDRAASPSSEDTDDPISIDEKRTTKRERLASKADEADTEVERPRKRINMAPSPSCGDTPTQDVQAQVVEPATKKKARRCTLCRQPNHDKRDCPSSQKGKQAHQLVPCARRRCSLCEHVGHDVRVCPRLAEAKRAIQPQAIGDPYLAPDTDLVRITKGPTGFKAPNDVRLSELGGESSRSGFVPQLDRHEDIPPDIISELSVKSLTLDDGVLGMEDEQDSQML